MDSDSDISQERAKRPSTISNFDDDSDDDSDDDLLLAKKATFRTSKRKKTNEVDGILGDAMKKQEKRRQDQDILQRMRREDLDVENLINSAQQMKNELAEKTVASTKKPQNAQAKKREMALVEVADTQLTISAGSREILQSCKPGVLPSSTKAASEYLQGIICEESNPSSVVKRGLRENLKQGSLQSFLLTGRLLSAEFHTKHTKILPFDIIRWLFEVACSTESVTGKGRKDQPFEILARGAYSTLSRLWMDHHGFCDSGLLLATRDMPTQLREWFGVVHRPVSLSSKGREENQNPKSERIPSSLALTRYLHLWEIAFSREMVHVNDLESISESIVSLVHVSLDGMFESSNTNANQALLYLQKLVIHFLDAATKICRENDLFDKFLGQLTEEIFSIVSSQGPGAPDTIDADDHQAWICQARVIRVLSSATYESTETSQKTWIATLVTKLCERVLLACSKQSSKALYDKVASIFTKWKLPQEMADCIRWKASATSLITLSLLNQSISVEGEEALCAALCEMSFLCFQSAVTLFSNINIHHSDSVESAALYTAYQEIESEISQIATKSNGLVLSNPHYLRVNYFANCFRQYPRLEKLQYQERQTVEIQANLESYFSVKEQVTEASE